MMRKMVVVKMVKVKMVVRKMITMMSLVNQRGNKKDSQSTGNEIYPNEDLKKE